MLNFLRERIGEDTNICGQKITPASGRVLF